MERRELIAAVGLLSVSGCSTIQSADTETGSAISPEETVAGSTTRSGKTATSSAAGSMNCQQQSRPEPSPDPALDPKEYPAFPDDLSRASVRRYCLAFERAYIWNWILSQLYDTVDIDVRYPQDPSVEIADGTVRFESYVRVTYASESGGADEPVQGDLKYDVVYEVTEDGTRRKSDREGDSTFTVVDCP